MYTKYLISYNDDNHEKKYWFDDEYLGNDPMEIAESMFWCGVQEGEYTNTVIETREINIFDLADIFEKEEDFNIVHSYLSREKDIDRKVWKHITFKNWDKVLNLIKGLDK